MIQRTLGSSSQSASAMVLGCWRLQQLPQTKLIELIETAHDHGIDCFDHADIYADGESESQFGKALAKMTLPRTGVMLQSKCGIRQGYYDLSKQHILSSVEASLQRLQTDYLDILLLHRPDALMEPDQIAEAFLALKESGKVRHFGVSNFKPLQINLLRQRLSMPLIINQMQFGLAHTGMIDSGIHANIHCDSAIDRDSDILDFCQLHKITVQAWSPLQFGMFEGNFIDHPNYAELNQTLDELAEHYAVSKSALALAWILRHPANMQVVVGSTQARRLTQMVKAADITLSREHWYQLYRASGHSLP